MRTPTDADDRETALTTIVCLADTDTRLKWSARVAERVGEGLEGRRRVVHVTVGDSAPTRSQRADVGLDVEVRHRRDDEIAAALDGADVVVVCTLMFRLHAVLEHVREVHAAGGRRPIVVTGYAGVVYEKHAMGALWRAGADVLCCNSEHDRAMFDTLLREFALDPGVLVRAGLGILPADRLGVDEIVRRCAQAGPPRTIVFAVQPDVPRSRPERLSLLRALADHAAASPERRVVVKLRSRPDETTTHPEPHHYEELARTHLASVPANLTFRYGVMSEVLAEADLLVTVSSTAALEALSAGVPACLLTDLGVRDDYGTPFFVGSGLLRTTARLGADEVPVPDARWLERNGFGADDTLDAVVERVRELVTSERLPEPPPRFFDEVNTPLLVRQTEERMGRASEGRSVRSVVRRVVNGPIRRLYLRLDGWLRR